MAMVSTRIRRLIFARDAGVCASCRTDCEKARRVHWAILDTDARWFYADLIGLIEGRSLWEVDHIQERANGGADDPQNLQTLCAPCHKAKSVRFIRLGRVARGGKPLRVPLNCLISPASKELLTGIQNETRESQGEIVDRALSVLTSITPDVEPKSRKVSRRNPLLKPGERK